MEMPVFIQDSLSIPTVSMSAMKVEPALSDIMEESTESTPEVLRDDNGEENTSMETADQSNTTQASSGSDTGPLMETMKSIEHMIRSKFGELNRTLVQHCNRTQRILRQIRLRINAFLRLQRPSIQRASSTRSRLPLQRPQYHPRSVAQRAATSRTPRASVQRVGPQRSILVEIAGQRAGTIRRRPLSSILLQARDNPGFNRSARASGTLRAGIVRHAGVAYSL